jgi:hypothetical protein
LQGQMLVSLQLYIQLGGRPFPRRLKVCGTLGANCCREPTGRDVGSSPTAAPA